MTLDEARELLAIQSDFGGRYNRGAARAVLAEVHREHGQAAVDRLICEFDLVAAFGFEPGISFESASESAP